MGGAMGKPVPRVVLLGLDGCGKTCIVRRLMHQEIGFTSPTFGHTISRVESAGTACDVVDVGGAPEMRNYWMTYAEGSVGIIFVIDCSDRRRLEEAGAELRRVLAQPTAAGLPVLILANKQDVVDALPGDKLVQALNLSAIRDRDWHVQPCSSRANQGVDEGTRWLLAQIRLLASQRGWGRR